MNEKKGMISYIQGGKLTKFMAEMRRENLVLILNVIYSSFNRELFDFCGHRGVLSNPPSRENLLESVINRLTPDIAILGSTTAFNSKFTHF